MINLKKAERVVIAITFLCLFFTAGYFIGRGASVQVISFEKLAQPSVPALAAPAMTASSAPASADAHVSPETESGVMHAEAAASKSVPGADEPLTDTSAAPISDTVSPSGIIQSYKININTASLSELDELPGIGPVLAQSIIDYRVLNAGFKSIEQIMDVDGIGEKKFAAVKDMITVG